MVCIINALEFARNARMRQDQTPVAEFTRLVEGLPAAQDGVITWRLAGRADSVGNAWLEVRAQGEVSLTCQRCLEPVKVSLDVDNSLRLLRTQSQLEAMDGLEASGEGGDVEYLVAEQRLDGLGLIEDELILAMPYVPMHETCPGDSGPAQQDDLKPGRPSPFAVLGRLKKH